MALFQSVKMVQGVLLLGKNVLCLLSATEDASDSLLALRIIRISASTQSQNLGHKSAVGRGGHKIDASRNFWDGSGLKIDSASTDVAWGQGSA